MTFFRKVALSICFMSIMLINVWAQQLNITPYPNSVDIRDVKVVCKSKLTCQIDAEFSDVLNVFSEQVANYTDFSVVQKKRKGFIIAESVQGMADEEYQLDISASGINIKASTSKGCFYGFQSVLQLLMGATERTLPICTIKDKPRYGWRGIMLDESRHFFGKHEVKLLLDMMAIHKLNIFHWHLTDTPGWRLEIKKYPKLTTVGAIGCQTDEKAPAQFYTQEEVKEIVAYAAARQIEVIPEIDMPGHAAAATRAYPYVSGGGSEKYPNFTFHPAKEETFQFLTDILKEVTTLFPSKYIHIGGDEVHFGNHQWKTFPKVQKLMKDNNWTSLVDVEHYFLNRMADTIKVLGKTVLGWDEVIGAGLKKENTAVMWWRHDKTDLLHNALSKDYGVIMCPRLPLYFDFVQHDSHTDGRRWNGFAPVEDVYAFPTDAMTGGADYNKSTVMGMQANIWSEVIHTRSRMEFMTFPRMTALSEAGWTLNQNKDWTKFAKRLSRLMKFYKEQEISIFNPLNVEETPEVKGPKKK